MTSTTFFIIFIPILAILLLSINLILAPHNPYQEKDCPFECGFNSFRGQNRTEFSISFFIFGLLFLLFDLEILLVYPYSVSSYNNDIYGLAIMIIFFILLTLGFVFELGKNALTIESKQITSNIINDKTPLDNFILKHKEPNSYTFTSLPLQSSINIFKFITSYLFKKVNNYITSCMVSLLTKRLTSLFNRYPLIYGYTKEIYIILQNVTSIYTTFLRKALRYLNKNYPSVLKIFIILYTEYSKVLEGRLENYHVKLFILIGILLKSTTYFYWLLMMLLAKQLKDYFSNNRDYFLSYKLFMKYPFLFDTIISLFSCIYLLSLYMCMDICYEGLIFPIVNKIKIFITNMKTIILKMSGWGWGSNNNPNPSPSPNPAPNPAPNPDPSNPSVSNDTPKKHKHKDIKKMKHDPNFKEIHRLSKEEFKERNKLSKEQGDLLDVGLELEKMRRMCNKLCKMAKNPYADYKLNRMYVAFNDKYFKLLPKDAKNQASALFELSNKRAAEGTNFDSAPNVQTYWQYVRKDSKAIYKEFGSIFKIYEDHSKKIKNDSLGKPDSEKSKMFNQELQQLKDEFARVYREKDAFMKRQLEKSVKWDAMMKEHGITMQNLYEKNILLK